MHHRYNPTMDVVLLLDSVLGTAATTAMTQRIQEAQALIPGRASPQNESQKNISNLSNKGRTV
jgi:hypothetical protein